MTKEELLAALAENPALLTEVLTDSHVDAYLATEQGKKFIQPKLDRYFNKGLESWKTNHLETLVNDEISKRYPAETPEMKRIRELEQKLEAQSKETLRKELTLKAQSYAGELGLPASLANYFVADTEEATRESISKFHEIYKENINSAIVEATKGHTPTVPANKAEINKTNSFSEFAKQYQKQTK